MSSNSACINVCFLTNNDYSKRLAVASVRAPSCLNRACSWYYKLIVIMFLHGLQHQKYDVRMCLKFAPVPDTPDNLDAHTKM